ncbi:MAG TPA: DUF1634 domain-containing protein [Verrucomicrobiae bacterium]|jgi:uncharacterized membrane protein|nr:DUF1634 domain-containing protein [Verrucomicrobiae bacterium]
MSAEQNVYADVYRLLVTGMLISTILFVIGIILALLHPQYFPLSARWVRQQYHAGLIVHGLLHRQPSSFFLAGTVLLILTPIARVLVSIYAFWVDHDHKYVAVTSGVLAIIVVTVILGLFGLR